MVEGKQDSGEKFNDYFDYSETISTIPSHRALALFRGRREEILNVSLRLDSEEEKLNGMPHFKPLAKAGLPPILRFHKRSGSRQMVVDTVALGLACKIFSCTSKPD